MVAAPSMTTEAQNALLKTLEEPPADALFFFIVASPESLLPTLRSRTQMLSLCGVAAESIVGIRAFLGANPTKRLDMLKPLFEKDADDKRDMSGVLTFLSALERAVGAKGDAAPGLESVYRARKYVGDKGSLVKPLLEQVALLLPVIKV
jgi:DNA polymerase III delta prime subunit